MAIEMEVCAAHFLLSIYKLRKEKKLQIDTHSEMTDAGTPPTWDAGVADHLETRCSPTCVILQNFITRGQIIWA